jgi:mono/diheme cytochrome c family protein
MMPGYRWLFHGAPTNPLRTRSTCWPTQDARTSLAANLLGRQASPHRRTFVYDVSASRFVAISMLARRLRGQRLGLSWMDGRGHSSGAKPIVFARAPASNTPPLRPGEVGAGPTLMLAGRCIFDTRCTRCHGDNGARDGREINRFVKASFPERTNVDLITRRSFVSQAVAGLAALGLFGEAPRVAADLVDVVDARCEPSLQGACENWQASTASSPTPAARLSRRKHVLRWFRSAC